MAIFAYPHPPQEVVQFFREHFGPTKMAFARLDAEQQKQYEAELTDMWVKNNEGAPGQTLMRNEYLEVIGTRI